MSTSGACSHTMEQRQDLGNSGGQESGTMREQESERIREQESGMILGHGGIVLQYLGSAMLQKKGDGGEVEDG